MFFNPEKASYHSNAEIHGSSRAHARGPKAGAILLPRPGIFSLGALFLHRKRANHNQVKSGCGRHLVERDGLVAAMGLVHLTRAEDYLLHSRTPEYVSAGMTSAKASQAFLTPQHASITLFLSPTFWRR